MAYNTIEKLLINQHGDLHQIIPQMATDMGQIETAQKLGVTQNWVSRWLRKNGYEMKIIWVKKEQK